MTDHRTCYNCAYVGATVGRPCYHPEVDEPWFRFRPVNGILYGCWRSTHDLYEARMGIAQSKPWPRMDEIITPTDWPRLLSEAWGSLMFNAGTSSNPAWIPMGDSFTMAARDVMPNVD